MTITRKDYLDGRVTHEQYYRSVNQGAGLSFVNANPEFLARVKAALDNGDEHLNSIPLKEWDARGARAHVAIATALRDHGDFFSLAGVVCCLKQAARDAVQ